MKKVLFGGIVLGSIAIASCVKESEQRQDFEIIHECNGATCSIELAPVLKTLQQDILGKEHIINSKKETADSYNIQWGGISNFADNSTLAPLGLTSCGGGVCSGTSNPTTGVFTPGQDVNISLSGTVTIGSTTYNLEDEQVQGGSFIVDQSDFDSSVVYFIPTKLTL